MKDLRRSHVPLSGVFLSTSLVFFVFVFFETVENTFPQRATSSCSVALGTICSSAGKPRRSDTDYDLDRRITVSVWSQSTTSEVATDRGKIDRNSIHNQRIGQMGIFLLIQAILISMPMLSPLLLGHF